MPHSDPEVARKYRQERGRLLKERDPDYGKKMYAKHRDKRRAEKRADYAANTEKYREYNKRRYAKNRDQEIENSQRYRVENRDEVNARAMARYYANREAICARRNEQRKRPEERQKQYARMRSWLKRNPDKAQILNAKIILNEQTGVPIRDIPKEIAEVKVEQLKVSRLVRELRAAKVA